MKHMQANIIRLVGSKHNLRGPIEINPRDNVRGDIINLIEQPDSTPEDALHLGGMMGIASGGHRDRAIYLTNTVEARILELYP